MKRKLYLLFFLCVATIVSSCAPTRFVEPLKKNENAIGVSLGGPMVKIPNVATTPLPFTNLFYGRGITDKLTLQGGWYPTASIFGVGQIDLGATYGIWESKNEKHGISAMLNANMAMDFFEYKYRVWPAFDAHYYFRYNKRSMTQDDMFSGGVSPKSNLLYFGFSTWFELMEKKAHDQKQTTHVLPTFNIGHDLNWKLWTFKAEIEFIAPFSSNRDKVVDFISATGKTGALGVFVGFTRKF